jgi:hypothetical protein
MGRPCSTHRKKINSYRVLVGESEGKRPPEETDVGGKIIIKWILEKYYEVVWTGLL